ncbi:MAG: DUF6164 family protein [Arenicellales bacterium]
MAIHLMSMRGVPEDEQEEICALLDQNNISHYVTAPGNWMISAGAIWLTDQQQLPEAHTLLNEYQQQRRQKAQEEYSRSRLNGEQESLLERILEHPLRFIGYLAIIIFILYVSLMPFVDFGQ